MDVTAGEQLRADIDAAVARASAELGQPLRFDEREARAVAAAVRAADTIALLERLMAAEAATEAPNTSVITKMAAEARQQDRHLGECLARLDLPSWAVKGGKSPRHAAMAQARWGGSGPRPVRRVK
ncbi:hypothetical protein [Mycolicibacter sinensis]